MKKTNPKSKIKSKIKKKETLHVYHLCDGEDFWYIASSQDDALNQMIQDSTDYDTIEQYLKENPRPQITQLDDDELLPVHMDDALKGEEMVEQTAAEWAKEGRGLVCSTLYS